MFFKTLSSKALIEDGLHPTILSVFPSIAYIIDGKGLSTVAILSGVFSNLIVFPLTSVTEYSLSFTSLTSCT